VARGNLAVQQITRAGISQTLSAGDATNHHKFLNDGKRTYLRAKNTDSSAKTLTFLIPGSIDGQSVANSGRQVVVPLTTGDLLIGPFPAAQYNQSDGYVYVNLSADTGVTLGVFRV
jgi:hypothetical protein